MFVSYSKKYEIYYEMCYDVPEFRQMRTTHSVLLIYMTIISVNGINISVRGRVEAKGSWLSVPNTRSVRRLERLLASPVEGEASSATVLVDGKPMRLPFVLHIQAPRKVSQEG